MTNQSKSARLPLTMALLGLVGMLLRFWLYATGPDENRLLRASHPAAYLILLLTLAGIAAAFWLSRSLKAGSPYEKCFPASLPGSIGTFIGTAGLLVAALTDLIRRTSGLTAICGFLGLLAAAALGFTGYCRLTGRRPRLELHAVVCIYFLVRLISRYQAWSSDPQLQDYCFQLLATVCLMLYSYHRSALDFQNGSVRPAVVTGMLSILFCCLASLPSDSPWMYLSLALWTGTNLGIPDSAAAEEAA